MVVTEENVKIVKDYYNQLIKEREDVAGKRERFEKLKEKKEELELDLKVQVYCNIIKEMDEILKEAPFFTNFYQMMFY